MPHGRSGCTKPNKSLHLTRRPILGFSIQRVACRRAGDLQRYAAMKTFGELTPEDLPAVVEIPRAAVHIAWTDDFYDGPLSGIAEWEGRRYRFEMTDRFTLGGDEDGSRRYWLIALSPEQLQQEERWQALFCANVWTGFDYTGRPERRAPPSEHAKFYEPYAARAVPDYSMNDVVGWFQL
jgi:hypothetical protein